MLHTSEFINRQLDKLKKTIMSFLLHLFIISLAASGLSKYTTICAFDKSSITICPYNDISGRLVKLFDGDIARLILPTIIIPSLA